MQLLVFICYFGVLLGHQIDVGVLLSLPEALGLCCYFFKGHTRVCDSLIYIFGILFELIIHSLSESHFYVLQEIIQLIFGLIENIIDLVLFVIGVVKSIASDAVELSFQLMIDVKVGSNGTLKVLLFHSGISTFDDV